jgi:hypothetical protein
MGRIYQHSTCPSMVKDRNVLVVTSAHSLYVEQFGADLLTYSQSSSSRPGPEGSFWNPSLNSSEKSYSLSMVMVQFKVKKSRLNSS